MKTLNSTKNLVNLHTPTKSEASAKGTLITGGQILESLHVKDSQLDSRCGTAPKKIQSTEFFTSANAFRVSTASASSSGQLQRMTFTSERMKRL